MTGQSDILDTLAAAIPCGYYAGHVSATEPTALAAIALSIAGRAEPAHKGTEWLARRQSSDGCLGVTELEQSPHWPTGWSVLAWMAAQTSGGANYRGQIERAIRWLTSVQGQPMQSVPELGHDPSLLGWPWVEGTHSWIEPTAIAVLALTAVGQRQHPRAQAAIKLLFDRQLPGGGWNYGNTVVLGQELLPHVQPTGLVLLALADEPDPKRRLQSAVKYLHSQLNGSTTTASLCFALLGLAGQGAIPGDAKSWLQQATARTWVDRPPYRLALLALAAQALDGQLPTGILRPAISAATN